MTKLQNPFKKPEACRDQQPAEESSPSKQANLFAVVSWGCAATTWLTKILNAHPEIFCVHNLKNHWAVATGTPKVQDSLLYMKVIDRSGRGYRLAGDCHGVAREEIGKIQDFFGSRFRSTVLTRHPVPRILSHFGIVAKAGISRYPLDYDALRATLPRDLLKLFDSKEKLFFAHMMSLVNVVTKEKEIGPLFKMEKLTSDFEELNRLLHFLSHGELKFEPQMIETLFNKPLVSHRNFPKAISRTASENFELLTGWQQEAFERLLDPEARKVYESLGYDFSFLR